MLKKGHNIMTDKCITSYPYYGYKGKPFILSYIFGELFL